MMKYRVELREKVLIRSSYGAAEQEFGPEYNFFPGKCVFKSWGVIASGTMRGKNTDERYPYKYYLSWNIVKAISETN